MGKNFDRVYRLEIGNDGEIKTIDGFQPSPLQVVFSVDQTPSARLTYAEITIYGLNRESKRKIYEEYTQVSLVAGYRDNHGLIFNGEIKNVEHGRDGANQYVKLYCRSGGKPRSMGMAWGAGTPRAEQIRDVAEAFGYPVEIIGDFSGLPALPKGDTLLDTMELKTKMDELAESWDFRWIITNQTLFILKNGEALSDPVHEIRATTGMVGSPRITTKGMDVTIKMNPSIRIGRLFKVEAETGIFEFNQVYYENWPEPLRKGEQMVLSVRIDGDYYGNAWDMDLEGVARQSFS